MKVDRESLLSSLEKVTPGLATREAVAQSSCFVFKDEQIMTFNDEVLTSTACPLGGRVTGAVAAQPLLDLLSRMTETTIEVKAGEGGLLVKGKQREASIFMEAEIQLPVSVVEEPEGWSDLDEEFGDAVSIVQHAAGRDANNFHLTCIHIRPDSIEACDNFQAARYPLKDTGVSSEGCLVKRDALRHVIGMGATQVAETSAWLHFRNEDGQRLAVRREAADYPDLDPILDVHGDPVTLPGGLAEAVARAEVFSDTSDSGGRVLVSLSPGKLILRGEGAAGWYRERKKISYKGHSLKFLIAPKLLSDITERTNECIVSPGRLRVDGGVFTFVTVLGKVDD